MPRERRFQDAATSLHVKRIVCTSSFPESRTGASEMQVSMYLSPFYLREDFKDQGKQQRMRGERRTGVWLNIRGERREGEGVYGSVRGRGKGGGEGGELGPEIREVFRSFSRVFGGYTSTMSEHDVDGQSFLLIQTKFFCPLFMYISFLF